MTPKQRLLHALGNEQADHVPAAPDFWQMIPIRYSGKKSWELLVYQDPPVWKVIVDACGYYGVDAFMPVFIPFEGDAQPAIVQSEEDKKIVRYFTEEDGQIKWSEFVEIYMPADPSAVVLASELGMGNEHEGYEVVQSNVSEKGKAYYDAVCDYVGDKGLVLPTVSLPALSHSEKDMYDYFDNPKAVVEKINSVGDYVMDRLKEIVSWNPEAIMLGNSGLMLFNPPHIFKKLTLKWFKKITAYTKEHGILTHIHCCGPEKALAEIAVEHTDLTSLEPLEKAPMGDCDLKEIKEKFGDKLALKGNLHTTEVMLFGDVEKVEDECKKAIDDAAAGGGFILSTGDQTPRDTPDENLFAMQKIAETYGKY